MTTLSQSEMTAYNAHALVQVATTAEGYCEPSCTLSEEVKFDRLMNTVERVISEAPEGVDRCQTRGLVEDAARELAFRGLPSEVIKADANRLNTE
jgi:hypothetical protein